MECLLLLAAVFGQSPSITIYHDKNFESRVVVSELSRDWLAYGDRPQLAEMSRKQLFLRDKVKFVAKDSDRRLSRIYDGYPFIQFGQNGELEQIDRRAFTASGCCLDSVYAIVHNATRDFYDWKNECDRISLQSELEHVGEVIRWLNLCDPGELKSHCRFYPIWGEPDNAGFLFVQDRFAVYDGYPVYQLPTLPKKPLSPMPWEE